MITETPCLEGYGNFIWIRLKKMYEDKWERLHLDSVRMDVSRNVLKIIEENPKDEIFIKKLLWIPQRLRLSNLKNTVLRNVKLFDKIKTVWWVLVFLRSLSKKELIQFYSDTVFKNPNETLFLNWLNPDNLIIVIELLWITKIGDLKMIEWVLKSAIPENLEIFSIYLLKNWYHGTATSMTALMMFSEILAKYDKEELKKALMVKKIPIKELLEKLSN